MDFAAILEKFWALGPVFAIMAIVIYIQYKEKKDLQGRNDKLQDKIDTVTSKAIEAINSSTNQANTFSGALANMMAIVQKQGEQWQSFKEDFQKELIRMARGDK